MAPRGRDAAVIDHVLSREKIASTICAGPREFLIELDRGADAAVLTEESLATADHPGIRAWLANQPSWADFPFILLAHSHGNRSTERLQGLTAVLGNVVVLERPINADTLLSAAASALRARDRQYEARRHWVQRENDARRLRIALAAGNLGAWSIDVASRVLTASDRVRAHLGRPVSAELSVMDFMSAIHPDDRGPFRDAVRDAIERQADLNIESRVVWPNGAVRWLEISGRTIFGDDGRPASVSGVSLDVTSRRQSETDLKARVDAAVAENQRAQVALVQAQKMEAVGQLTGGIAHDFNNLLTAIIGNIDLIDRRAEDPRIRVMAGRARAAADRASRLTSQLLAFSRSQRLDLRPLDIDRIIGGLHDLVRRTIGPTIEVTIDLNASGLMAIGDANQLELAILNLAINARDAMPAGGSLKLTTRVEQPAEGSEPGQWIVISVSDTGTGIPADLLSRVFEPFFTTKPVGKGTGLGLSQVHGIAHQSGGSVKIASREGEGTTIEIWLRESGGKPVLPEAADDDEAALFLGAGRILVVDDDEDVRRFVVECLKTLGFAVTQADHGQAGLDRLGEDNPDLLIVDFAMPGLNGAQVASAARAWREDLPIILITGYADTRQVSTAFEQDAILRKPFRIHDLSRAVKHALEPLGS